MNKPAQPGYWQISHSPGLRALTLGLLALLMLIPLWMVSRVVDDRNQHHQQALGDIAATWGNKQALVGPVLVIPYVEHITSVDTVTEGNGESKVLSKDVYNEHTVAILPTVLDVRADLKEEQRVRGLHEALVYKANLSLSGRFDYGFLLEEAEGERRIHWDQAFLAIGISDTKAIDKASTLQWGTDKIILQPGTQLPELLPQGVHVPLDKLTGEEPLHEFKLDLQIRGSDGLLFAPVGEVTTARMTSSWEHPSFQGSILPDKQETNKLGFTAHWEIPNLARNYPQHWLLDGKASYDPTYFTAGVSLYEPVSRYSQIARAAKYGILFVTLTFLTLFAFELAAKQPLHALQYVLVGAAQALFYLILLALAEHLPFKDAYLAAAGVTVGMISLYTWAVLRSFWKALVLLLVLGGLYYVLYHILKLEDYALLAGTGLVALALLMMMFVTRHLHQQATERSPDLGEEQPRSGKPAHIEENVNAESEN